jgi:beta-lactamase class A
MPRILCLLSLAFAAWGQTETAALLEAKTLAELRRFDEGFEGALGVAAIDLQTGGAFALNGDAAFPQASVIKIPIMVRMFMAERAGEFRFADKITLEPRDTVGGSGRIQNELKKGPVTLTVRELVSAMMVDSDNTATNWCIRAAGMARVNEMLAANGFRHTRLRRVMMDGEAARRDDENSSTPNEMARLVELIWRGRIADPQACREMLEIMKRVKGQIREGLPEGVEAAVKPGGIPGVRAEAGVVYVPGRPFVLSVMSAFIGERTPVPDAARIVYRMFDRLSRANRYGHTVR